jgi:uncharacterized membrane protein YgcG
MIEGSRGTTRPARPAGRISVQASRWLVLLLGGLALVPPALVACGSSDDSVTPSCPNTPGAYGSSSECFTQPGSASTKNPSGAGGDTGAGGDSGAGGEGGAGGDSGGGGEGGAAGSAGAGGG